jgi:surface carbohydrate biosynthesis protein
MSVLGISDIPDYTFAHGTLGDSGAFWTSSAERSEIMHVLKMVKNMSASEWYKESQALQEQVMAYDSANLILRSRLASLGVDVKDVRERSYELMPEVPK